MFCPKSEEKIIKVDKEVQTDLRCTPHFLTPTGMSRVIQEEECQTAISAHPGVSMTNIIPDLEYTDPRLLETDSIYQIGGTGEERPTSFEILRPGITYVDEEPQVEAVETEG